MKMNFIKNRASERGNALFLILIAVALFAALSYAVTQSSGGGGGIDREKGLISAAQVTQYPSLLRTTVTRMILTGTAVNTLTFDPAPPNTYDAEVFGATGGAVSYKKPPKNIGVATDWGFTHDIAGTGIVVDGVGTDAGIEVLAYLNGITLPICEQIRKGLGLPSTPTTESVAVVFPVYTFVNNAPPTVVGGGTPPGTLVDDVNTFFSDTAEAFSCVDNAGTNVYYHTLAEQ